MTTSPIRRHQRGRWGRLASGRRRCRSCDALTRPYWKGEQWRYKSTTFLLLPAGDVTPQVWPMHVVTWEERHFESSLWAVLRTNKDANTERCNRDGADSNAVAAPTTYEPRDDAAHNPDAANPNYVVPHGRLCGLIPTQVLTLRRRGFTIDEMFWVVSNADLLVSSATTAARWSSCRIVWPPISRTVAIMATAIKRKIEKIITAW